MSEQIDLYLDRLRAVLAGSDTATVHDAIADAEEHLRTALEGAKHSAPDATDAELLAPILAQYGTPEEVAKAYLDLETRMVPTFAPRTPVAHRSVVGRVVGVLVDPRAYAALLFMLFSLITGVLFFTWAVTGISLSLGLAITILGLPFFGFFVYSVEGLALVEGRIVEAMLGVRMPRRQSPPQKGIGVWRRFKARLTDKRGWTSILYMILKLPLGVLSFSVFITLIAYALQLILHPVIRWLWDAPFINISGVEYFVPVGLYPVFLIAGILDLILILHLARFAAKGYGAMAKAMLVRA
ncbi:MAG: membrane protein [Gemmatimonadota bacterium]|nr:MAG: membrane protein [Gemmatimonadota bacterium]